MDYERLHDTLLRAQHEMERRCLHLGYGHPALEAAELLAADIKRELLAVEELLREARDG